MAVITVSAVTGLKNGINLPTTESAIITETITILLVPISFFLKSRDKEHDCEDRNEKRHENMPFFIKNHRSGNRRKRNEQKRDQNFNSIP
jgi:hypothetical protein